MMAAQSDACYDEDNMEVDEKDENGVGHHGGGYYPPRTCPYGSEPYPCYCKPCCNRKKDYYCPPLVMDCPGVVQPAGPCMDAVCERPLHYNNDGHVCTHWKHNVDVSGEPCCKCDSCPGYPSGKHDYPYYPKPCHCKPYYAGAEGDGAEDGDDEGDDAEGDDQEDFRFDDYFVGPDGGQ